MYIPKLLQMMKSRKSNGSFTKVEEVRIIMDFGAPMAETRNGPTFANTSVLADGDVFKISFDQSGVYKLDYNFLKDLGVDIDNINPKNLAVYTSEGRAVPENLNENRFDDLIEAPIYVQGESDNSFDSGDFALFYATGSESWRTIDGEYQYNKNIYSDLNYAFIKVKSSAGKRISAAETVSNTAFTSSVYNDLQRYEEDKVNLLGAFSSTQGTGQLWFGDRYNTIREYDYTDQFDLDGYVAGEDIKVNVAFAGRCDVNNSKVYLDIGDTTLDKNIFRVTTSGSSISTTRYASYVDIDESTAISNSNGSIVLRYPFQGNVTSEGWLDYLQLIVPKSLEIGAVPILISNQESINHTTTALTFSGSPDHIWDITDVSQVAQT